MTTTRKSSTSEHGQAVVLIVLAMVVLLGFTALAVDGSMVYSDRRYAQNAADASSMAGAGMAAKVLEQKGVDYKTWTASPPNCSGAVAEAGKAARESAIKRALDNSFTIDQNIKDNHGVVAECGMDPIYATKAGGGTVKIMDDKYMDVHTMITSQTQTAFAHFVFRGPMVNTVNAVARVRPRRPLAFGYAIVALNDDTSNCNKNGAGNGVGFHGLSGKTSGNLTVNGGGIWSNGCLDPDGNVNVTVNNGPVNYFETANNPDLGDITLNSGTLNQLANTPSNRIPPETYDIPMPNCSGHEVDPSFIVDYSKNHIDPVTKKPIPIPSGLYCVTDDLKINAKDYIEGHGVTFVLYKGMTINGGATLLLQAPAKEYVGPALPNILFYSPKSNTSTIEVNGNQDSVFHGTILAPAGNISFTGNEGLEFTGQIIGNNVSVGGSSTSNVTYDDNNSATVPAALDLYR